jgi:hypothetical protein
LIKYSNIQIKTIKLTHKSALDIRKERVVFAFAVFNAVAELGGAPKRIFVRGF